MPTGPMARPTMKGIRQPQAAICSVGRSMVTQVATSAASTLDRAMLAWIQEAYTPRLPAGACSIRKAVAPPISPPAEKP